MIPIKERASNKLSGQTLNNGWKVIKQLVQNDFHNYTACYEVEKEGRQGFLKAFDYSNAAKVGSKGMEDISEIIKAFKFEKYILQKCTEYKCSNIIEYYDDGEIDIDGVSYPRVHYIIMEYSEKGNVNNIINNNDLLWKIKSLHQITMGLNQLHKISIAHLDLKPENTVVCNNNTKISDFGSALDLESDKDIVPSKYLTEDYSGTWELSPPEILYGDIPSNQIIRRIGCDLYMLGSLMVYYFTKSSMNTYLKMNLAKEFEWSHKNYGKFEEFKAYIIEAFENSLIDIGYEIADEKLRVKVIECLRYLCHPEPKYRGHYKNTLITNRESNFGLDRFISIFNWMSTYISVKKLN